MEAGILSDILLLRAVDNPPSYVLWSVLVGVSISRGDWDTAVDVLAKMECNEDAILLKNIYKTKSSRKPIKKLYRGAVVSQTVELGVLYAIDGGLPLLTRGGVEALQAMNLERLLPKENNLDDNGDVKSSVQAPDRIVGQNIERESAVKTQKVHNLNGIAHSLSQIPKRLLLDTSNKRTVCTVGDILGFLEACRGADGVQMAQGAQVGLLDDIGESDVGSGEDYSGVGPRSFDDDSTYDDYDAYVPKKKPFKKVPVGVALLQSLFAAAINERKYKQAARIIRLLEGSRLVIDLDAPALIAVPVSVPPLPLSLSSPLSTPTGEEEYSASLTASSSVSDDKIGKVLSRSSDSPSDASAVKVVRETLARKWAALLIGSSLNKLKNNVAGSVKMMAALKYLQKEETDERNEMN